MGSGQITAVQLPASIRTLTCMQATARAKAQAEYLWVPPPRITCTEMTLMWTALTRHKPQKNLVRNKTLYSIKSRCFWLPSQIMNDRQSSGGGGAEMASWPPQEAAFRFQGDVVVCH